MGFKDKFRRKKTEHQDRQHKHTEWRYEGGNGGHRVTFARDLHYHPSETTPAQSRTDLELPKGGEGIGAAEDREWRNGRERRGRGRRSTMPDPASRRRSHGLAQGSPEDSADEEVVTRSRTRDSNTGTTASPAAAAAAAATGIGAMTTATTTATTTETDRPTTASGGGWSPYLTGAAVGIGVLCTPFIAAGVVTATGYACAAAGATMVVNNLSNNNRAVQESHDRRMIAEAEIEAARDVKKHKATVAAQERVMTKMVDKGQYEALNLLGNGEGSSRTKKNGRRGKEIGGPRRAGLLEYHNDFDSC